MKHTCIVKLVRLNDIFLSKLLGNNRDEPECTRITWNVKEWSGLNRNDPEKRFTMANLLVPRSLTALCLAKLSVLQTDNPATN